MAVSCAGTGGRILCKYRWQYLMQVQAAVSRVDTGSSISSKGTSRTISYRYRRQYSVKVQAVIPRESTCREYMQGVQSEDPLVQVQAAVSRAGSDSSISYRFRQWYLVHVQAAVTRAGSGSSISCNTGCAISCRYKR